MFAPIHKPVLLKEVLEYLQPLSNENFIDCTVGEGGHTKEILKRNGPEGKVLGIDLDPVQISSAQWLEVEFKNRIILINDSYVNLEEIVKRKNFEPVNGILLDLGMSSVQLEHTERGFSFKLNQRLDMRYNDEVNSLTAEKIVNEWPEKEIEKILKTYGQERFAKRITRKIMEYRKKGRIKTTLQLIGIIREALPTSYLKRQKGRKGGSIHFATRTFQALRIAVNDELENLKMVLPQAISLLAPGGRIVVISFHSLEDAIIKKFFLEQAKKGIIQILTKKPLMASAKEVKNNPRARSAKLRAAIKI